MRDGHLVLFFLLIKKLLAVLLGEGCVLFIWSFFTQILSISFMYVYVSIKGMSEVDIPDRMNNVFCDPLYLLAPLSQQL